MPLSLHVLSVDRLYFAEVKALPAQLPEALSGEGGDGFRYGFFDRLPVGELQADEAISTIII